MSVETTSADVLPMLRDPQARALRSQLEITGEPRPVTDRHRKRPSLWLLKAFDWGDATRASPFWSKVHETLEHYESGTDVPPRLSVGWPDIDAP